MSYLSLGRNIVPVQEHNTLFIDTEVTTMRISFTKKKIKRIAAIASLAAATAAVAVTAIVTSVGTHAEEHRLPIYRVERGDNKIALTFDVAWENSNTGELIDILGENNARATFFVTGDWCDRYPDDVRMFFDAGHEIQNHSDQHPHVKGINVNDLINDTREASRKITAITGEEPTLYRAPYGEYDDSMLTTVEGMGLKVIQWDVDSIDWKDPTPDEIKTRILDKTKSGSILLFHNDLENTTEALPQILTELKSRGFEFVPVSELIYSDNYTIDANGEQSPIVQSSLDISDVSDIADMSEEDIRAVISQNADKLAAAGFTEEQALAAAASLKGGNIPDEVQAVIAQLTDAVPVSAGDASTETAAAETADNTLETADTADTTETADTADTNETFETAETADTTETTDSADTAEPPVK